VARRNPAVASARFSAAELDRLDRICAARGTTRSAIVRAAVLDVARARGHVPAAPDASEVAQLRALPTGEARARFRRLRRERRLASAPSADVVGIVADALGRPGASPDEIADGLDAIAVAAPDATLRILLEVVRRLMPAARPKLSENRRGGSAFGDPRRIY
jgi:hypothetical protein